MKVLGAVATIGIVVAGMGMLSFSRPAQARIPAEACRPVYADCEAGDQSACDSRTYQICMAQWGPVLPLPPRDPL